MSRLFCGGGSQTLALLELDGGRGPVNEVDLAVAGGLLAAQEVEDRDDSGRPVEPVEAEGALAHHRAGIGGERLGDGQRCGAHLEDSVMVERAPPSFETS